MITGKDFARKKFSGALAYGEVKYMAALWMAYRARTHPNLGFITMSPGIRMKRRLRTVTTPLRILIK